MPSLVGGQRDRYPLDRAVDELVAAGRWAGRPGLAWVAGVLYPNLLINVGVVQGLVLLFDRALGGRVSIPLLSGGDEFPLLTLPQLPLVANSPSEMVVLAIVLALPALIAFRLNVGLAAIAAPDAEEPRTLRAAWRAGRGLAWTALGMWLCLMGLLVCVMGFLFTPALVLVHVLALDQVPALFTLSVVPVVLLVLAYGVVLLVLHMLALTSLALNRRGVGSALVHAWRLIRGEPWGAVRAALVDLSLQAIVVLVHGAAAWTIGRLCLSELAVPALQVLLLGVSGLARASFWARTYRGLGGPLRSDRLPGLALPAEA